jgi:hypothetical protein
MILEFVKSFSPIIIIVAVMVLLPLLGLWIVFLIAPACFFLFAYLLLPYKVQDKIDAYLKDKLGIKDKI